MMNESLGSYRILHLIGQGGMGAVYAAQHMLIGKKAAVKVLLPALSRDPEMVQRFFNEARSAALIHHPGLVEIFDFGHHTNGSVYLVMELLEGETLTSRLRRDRRLPVPLAAGLGGQLAAAVGAAHAHGIVHRDLKPDNLFLVPDQVVAQRIRMKVLDFGIAKLTSDSGPDSLHTRTGALMGTPPYMSPEQCRGTGGVDHRSDIYSLGVILYEMLSGARPLGGNSPGEVMAAQLHQQPVPLRAHDPGIPPPVEEVVMTCLAKDPMHRFQTMEALATALESASSGVAASAATPYPPLQAPYTPAPVTTLRGSASQTTAATRGRSHGLWIGLGAVVIAGAVGVGLLATRSGGRSATATLEKPVQNPPDKPAAPTADHACDASHPDACARLGLAFELGHGKQRSFESALGAYLRGCDANAGDACAGLARLYLAGNGVRREPARALAASQKACEARSAQGCYQLGDMYDRGVNIPADHARALTDYETACELGSVGGCIEAGRMLVYGFGVPADRDKGKRLQHRGLELGPSACDAGSAFACEQLGVLYFHGNGVEIDATRAMALLQQACKLGFATACAELGFLYQNGRGIPMDRDRAFSLIRVACEGGYSDGCSGLGDAYLRGLGVAKDEKRGLALLDGACLKGAGCGSRAKAYLNGVGGPVDKVKALEVAERGCDAGDTNSCSWVGGLAPTRKTEMNRRACDAGDPGGCLDLGMALWNANDKATAVALFDKTCSSSGGEVGCNWLAFAYLDGEGTAKDEKRGLALLERACDQSDSASCTDLAMLYARGKHVPLSAGHAAELLDKSCVLQSGHACRLLAERYASGNGVPRDGAHATELRQKACTYGDTVACKGQR